MKTYGSAIIIFTGIVLFFVLTTSIIIVDETEQVLVTRFEKPVRKPIQKAGFHFKFPWEKTIRFEKRILQWDGDAKNMSTREKRNIFVDTTARWRIDDPLLFLESATNLAGGAKILDGFIDSATREVISRFDHVEIIRDSNRIIDVIAADEMLEESFKEEVLSEISYGREKLTQMILESAGAKARERGIELLDVRIKKINYVASVLEQVYQRMEKEREQISKKFWAIGQGEKERIEGETTRDQKRIASEAYRTVQEIRGKADAKALKIYADAYGQDPDFYRLIKTLETYEKTLDARTRLLLSTDTEYFRLLKGLLDD